VYPPLSGKPQIRVKLNNNSWVKSPPYKHQSQGRYSSAQ
jgi:hypothetical protein